MGTDTGSAGSRTHTKVLVIQTPTTSETQSIHVAGLVPDGQTCYALPPLSDSHQLKYFCYKMEDDRCRWGSVLRLLESGQADLESSPRC